MDWLVLIAHLQYPDLKKAWVSVLADGHWVQHSELFYDDDLDQQHAGQVDFVLSDFLDLASLRAAFCRPSTTELAAGVSRNLLFALSYELLRAIFRRARHLHNPTRFTTELGDEEENSYTDAEKRVAEVRIAAKQQVTATRIVAKQRVAKARKDVKQKARRETERSVTKVCKEAKRRVAKVRKEAKRHVAEVRIEMERCMDEMERRLAHRRLEPSRIWTASWRWTEGPERELIHEKSAAAAKMCVYSQPRRGKAAFLSLG